MAKVATVAGCLCLAPCAASLLSEVGAQESTISTEARQSVERLRSTAEALEEQIAKTREQIAEERAALTKLEAQRAQVLKDVALREKAMQEAGDTHTANLFSEGVKHWKVLDDFPSNGGIEAGVEPGVFRMKMGDPLSGIRYQGPLDLPVTNYEIALEARRTKGSDFFCGLTFPVNSIKTCCTFVAGGWGGALAGISSLEGMDAANNDTSTFHKFEVNHWYAFRIQVTPELLKVWMDDKVIVDAELADRRVGMRWGDIEYCAPFGLASYQTTGEFRNFKVRRLDGKPLEQKKAAKAPTDAKDGATVEE